VPVEFLTDEEAARYGRFSGAPSRAELERAFFLDDVDKALVARRRGDHNRLGFALQLTTARFLGTFLPDPLAVPGEVVAYLAEQLGIADPSCLGRYTERRTTRFEHVEEIKAAYGLRDFAEVAKELEACVDARAWTTGDGPKAIFIDALSWLAERDVLLPGLTTLTRLVARVRDQATARLWESLYEQPTEGQRALLEGLLGVSEDAGVSDLERWRKGPVKSSGRGLEQALARVSEITAVDLGHLDLDAVVPHRRLVELARYGMAAKAAQLRRHPPARRLATLLSTVAYLKASAVDDALELLDLLVTTELLGKAERETKAERLRQHPRLVRASATLAGVVRVVLGAMGKAEEEVGVHELWEAIEAVASRVEMAAAVSTVDDLAPPPGGDDEEDVRAELAKRITMVSGFMKTLTEAIDFEANAEAAPVLGAMEAIPSLL